MAIAADNTLRRPVLADLITTTPTRTWARDALIIAAGAGLTGLAAQWSEPVPGSPVPVTGQTLAVLLVGAAVGPVRAAASMLLYLVVGMAGAPWFAGGSSGSLSMPTLGYIVGFILAGALIGTLARRGFDRSPVLTVVAMIAGNLVIYAVGVPWLAASLHVSLGKAISLGVRPFLLGDALKTAIAAGLLPGAWRLLK